MKKISLITLLFFGQAIFARTFIKCEGHQSVFSIEIKVDNMESLPARSEYKVFKNNRLIKVGYFNKVLEVYIDFLNSYVLEFQDNDGNSLGIAILNLKSLKNGSYPGKSDVFIVTSEDASNDFDANTIDCNVTVD